MKNKLIPCLLAGVLILTISACGTKQPLIEGQEPADAASADQKITLEVMNPKVEISTQFEQMVKEYEKENPNVDIHIVTFGGGANYPAELKARFAANKGPDIFPNGGYEEAKAWIRYLEDLSDQPWVPYAYDEALEPMRMDGKLYGMPFNYEGYGFIYNKDLLAKAGIDTPPKTLTELKEVAEKLRSAGITPFAAGYADSWFFVLLWNIAFAQQDDPDAFIQALNEGTEAIDRNEKFEDVTRLVDLTVQYGDPDYLTTDYNAEVALFASGKAAILKQGNWAQFKIDEITPNLNIGFLPIPINNDSRNDALPVGISNYWAVNKESTPEKKQEAKKFLNWMVSAEKGRAYMKEQFHYISAFKHIESDRSRPLEAEIMRYVDQKKTLSWNWFKFPPGVKDEFGYLMQAYIGKQLTRDQLLQELQKSWEKGNKK